MDHVKSDFLCPIYDLKVKKKLCEDLPGVHTSGPVIAVSENTAQSG